MNQCSLKFSGDRTSHWGFSQNPGGLNILKRIFGVLCLRYLVTRTINSAQYSIYMNSIENLILHLFQSARIFKLGLVCAIIQLLIFLFTTTSVQLRVLNIIQLFQLLIIIMILMGLCKFSFWV